MRRFAFALVVVASCSDADSKPGGTGGLLGPGPSPQTAPDPDVCRPFDRAARTVNVVDAGTGARSLLRYAFKSGTRQSIEVTLDRTIIGVDPPVAGPPPVIHEPTLVLAGDAEIRNVDASGNAELVLAIHSAKARGGDPGAAEALAPMNDELAHMKVMGTVHPDGSTNLKACAPGGALGAMAIDFATASWPAWPMLPATPVGTGAIWEIARQVRVAFDSIETTRFELKTRTADQWTATGAISIALPAKHDPIDRFEARGTLEASAGATLPSLTYARTIRMFATTAEFGFIDAAQVHVH